MKIAILQSNFLPWPGYFSLINSVDIFYFYDSVKYTKRDWRNRNFIKGSNGKILITIPIKKSTQNTPIRDIQISKTFHIEDLKKTIYKNYKKSVYFDEIYSLIFLNINNNQTSLSELNQSLIKIICNFLEIKTEIRNVNSIESTGKNEKLIEICNKVNAKIYLSGEKAKNYIDESLFIKNNIRIQWMKYKRYDYPQLWGEFIPNLSIIDMLFNLGKNAKLHI